MSDHQSSRKKRLLSRVTTIVCLGVFIYSAYSLINIGLDYYHSQQVTDDVQATFHGEPAHADVEAQSKEELTIRPDFAELREENSDVAGWISINDTKIDYPIVQSDDNEEYLTQNFYQEHSVTGSIFMDYRNSVESMSRNTVVYGHRTKDGSMFQHLTKFMDQDFFDNHRTFEMDTLYDHYQAKIFAVYNTTTDFNYIKTDFESDAEFKQLISDSRNESRYETDVNVSADDKIITLSTCDYELDENEGRLVVQAKLVKQND